ncbi:hypothetical protein CPC08DRAFT_53908 [Agrocybe pediades]|nr:hypothetical protein CPC08DRAFT_53908 [Agrocybe pediades]
MFWTQFFLTKSHYLTMNQALDTTRDELKAAVVKVLSTIKDTQDKANLKALVEKLLALREILDSRLDHLPAEFRAWDTGFERWAQDHVSFFNSFREGPDSQVWNAFFDKKDALNDAIQHLT